MYGHYILDIIVDDTALVEEFDAGEEGAEPFLRVRLGDFDCNEAGMICPVW